MSQLTISLFDIPKKTGATGSVGVGAVPLLPLSIIDHVPVLAPPATAGHIRHLGHGGHQLSDIQGAAILTIFVNKTQYSDTFTTLQSEGSKHFEYLQKLLFKSLFKSDLYWQAV